MKNIFLILVILGAALSLLFSLLSVVKLESVGSGDSILTPLRIVNRSVALLASAVVILTLYLWRKEN